MRHDEHWYCEDHRPPGMRGVVYQNFWMRKRGISPVPAWLVGWLSSLSKNFERGGKGGARPNGSPLAMKRGQSAMPTFRFDRKADYNQPRYG